MSCCNAHLRMTLGGLKHSSDSQMSVEQSPSQWAWLATPLQTGPYSPSQAHFSSFLISHDGSIADTTCFVFQILLRLWIFGQVTSHQALPRWSVGKESACNAGELGLIPGLERSPGVRNGNPLQYSYLENSMDRGAWRATVHGVAKSQTQLNDLTWHSIAHFSSFQSSGLLSSKYISLPLFFPSSWIK